MTVMSEDANNGLTESQKNFFQENGYLVIAGFFDEINVKEMRDAIAKHLEAFNPDQHRNIFTTENQTKFLDEYFLSSSDKVHYFFEQDAFDFSTGELKVEKSQAINKVGHALHDLDPVFTKCSYDARILAICKSLGMKSPIIPQSMYIFKQAKIGGAVNPHQDATFLYTEPQSVLGFWWPLEDCTKQNGCLWAVPGSHRLDVSQHFQRLEDGSGCVFVPSTVPPFSTEGAVPLEITKGSLVLIHNALVHYSEANTSDSSRHAYTIHVVDAETHYPKENWLQRPTDNPFRPFIVKS